MPIYEYECKSCGHHFDAFQKMGEKALIDCPSCHKPDLQKLVSAAGFQLKGTGWYATDFKNKKSEPPKQETKPKEDKKSSSEGSTGTTT